MGSGPAQLCSQAIANAHGLDQMLPRRRFRLVPCAGRAGPALPPDGSSNQDRRPSPIASPSACARRCRARCCSTASRAGAIRPMRRTTRSSRWAWWCRRPIDDVRAAMAIAREEGVPLLPRGGATSQSGQTVGRALVIDFSKHLNRLIAVDPAARTCIVEPGIVLDELNRQLRSTGPVVSRRRLHLEPRHHRRHGRQQLLRHALDPLRHHARQRPRHRRHPGRRDARRASARSATISLPSQGTASPPPRGERDGEGGNHQRRPSGFPPPLTPPHKGEGNPARRFGPRRPTLALFRDLLALGRREQGHIAHAFPEVSRRVGGYLIDALLPGAGPSISPRCCAARRARSPSRGASN